MDAAAYASMSLNAWTPVEPDLAVRLLRQGGHSGKQFAAYYARLESLEVFWSWVMLGVGWVGGVSELGRKRLEFGFGRE